MWLPQWRETTHQNQDSSSGHKDFDSSRSQRKVVETPDNFKRCLQPNNQIEEENLTDRLFASSKKYEEYSYSPKKYEEYSYSPKRHEVERKQYTFSEKNTTLPRKYDSPLQETRIRNINQNIAHVKQTYTGKNLP